MEPRHLAGLAQFNPNLELFPHYRSLSISPDQLAFLVNNNGFPLLLPFL